MINNPDANNIERDARLQKNWDYLMTLCREQLINTLADRAQHGSYSLMLNALRQDSVSGTGVRLGLYRSPASKDYHHQQEGGLVEHILEMWTLWQGGIQILIHQYTRDSHPLMVDSIVFRAILHHDLNKVWRYVKMPAMDGSFIVDYAYDRLDDLLGPQGKSLYFLQKYGITMTPALTNALLASEGGYSQNRPRKETVLAKTVYLLDELSANVVDRLNNDRFWNAKGETHEDAEG